mgnify:CR=1 FL=1
MFRPRLEKKEMIEFLKKHKDFTQEWLDQIENEPIDALGNSLSDLGKKMASRVREVQKEYHRQRSFLRLDSSLRNLVSAEVECNHNIERMILNHLHLRFPRKIIVIYSKYKHITYIFDGIEFLSVENSLSEVIKQYHSNRIEFEEKTKAECNDIKEIFKSYYESQYIESRYNPRYFHKFMTKENLKSSNQQIEQSAFNRSLDEFLKINKDAKELNKN